MIWRLESLEDSHTISYSNDDLLEWRFNIALEYRYRMLINITVLEICILSLPQNKKICIILYEAIQQHRGNMTFYMFFVMPTRENNHAYVAVFESSINMYAIFCKFQVKMETQALKFPVLTNHDSSKPQPVLVTSISFRIPVYISMKNQIIIL